MDRQKWIKEVDSVEVPKEEVFQAISQGIKQAEKPRRKKRIIIGALTAAAAIIIIGSGFVSPTANQVLAKTPILGELYKKFDDKLGMKLAEKDMVTNLNETITKNGVTLKVTSAYFDGFQVTIVGEVYKKGKWPANEPDEISFDMNFEGYKGDADPWLDGHTSDFIQIKDGFEFHWTMNYPYEDIKENIELPITIHNINGVEGDWKFSVPVEQKKFAEIDFAYKETFENGSYIETKRILEGAEYPTLIYSIANPNENDVVFLSKAMDDKGNELFSGIDSQIIDDSPDDSIETFASEIHSMDKEAKSITFYPYLNIYEDTLYQNLSESGFVLASKRTDLALHVNSVKQEKDKLILDYNITGTIDKASRSDLITNLESELTLVDEKHVKDIDEDNPFPPEGHSISRNKLKVLDRDKLHFQSVFNLKGEEKIENFKLEETVLGINFSMYFNSIKLEPFTVKLKE
ncbi:DUF4179 domain-containing protein [Bacillus sp. Au-Bac7]|uniref:DUF4179 domain-containing protein n=1 Tax=Bacillus sp. Au-Bac7 TaxID=2906458 RepID=UPI001E5C48BC|nr:DUF4179 domain-containing protein [Bacillus sp. Au-Bac7]MCE4049830.1 DUF4179 domain-containing protein [Bacillus sp. Au-Bac7]